jgi:hypothetical protein
LALYNFVGWPVMVCNLFRFFSPLLSASVLMLALFSGVSTARSALLRFSTAFHAGTAPSSVHSIQQEFASLDAEDLIGTQGEAISVKIKLPFAPQAGAREAGLVRFLMLRGLPEALTLSAGFQTKTAWVVSVADLPNLQLLSAPDFQGAFLIDVTAHSADRRIVARAAVPIVISPRAFSGKVDTGFPSENATKQRVRAPFRFNRNGKGSGQGRGGPAADPAGTGREAAIAAPANRTDPASGHGDQKMRAAFEVFLTHHGEGGADGPPDQQERDALYAEFVRWWISTRLREPD